MVFLGILAAVAVIVVWYYVGKEFQHIAEMKGHNGKKYFWWSFLFSAAGMLMVVALPDRGSASAQAEKNAMDELPEL